MYRDDTNCPETRDYSSTSMDGASLNACLSSDFETLLCFIWNNWIFFGRESLSMYLDYD